MRWRPLLIVAAALGAIALLVIVGLFAFRDLTADAIRGVVVPRLEAITHRDVSITGDFDLVPSVTPTLAAEGLVVANAPWGSRPGDRARRCWRRSGSRSSCSSCRSCSIGPL